MVAPYKIGSGSFLAQWLGLGSALSILFALIAINLYRDHGRIGQREEERLTTQARVVAENIEFQLATVDLTLGRIVAKLANSPQSFASKVAATAYFSALVDAMPGVRTIAILDANGKALASNRHELIGQNFSERAYFSHIKDHPDTTALYVSSPFRSVLNPYVVNVTRMIPGYDGEFAGIVFATLDPKYFNTLVASVLYAPDMWGMLTHSDGQAFVIQSPQENLSDQYPSQPEHAFMRLGERQGYDTVMNGDSLISDAGQIVAQRTVGTKRLKTDKALVIAVGRDRGQIFMQWRQDIAFRAMVFALICVASFMALRAYQIARHRLDRQKVAAAASLQAARDNYQLIVENTADLVARISPEGRYTYLNRAFCGMFGKTATDRVGEYFAARVVRPDRELAKTSFRKLFEPPHALSFTQREKTIIGIRYLQWTAKALFDPQGQITEIIAIGRDMTEHMRRVGTLEHQAFRDFLTGLANRRYFTRLAKDELVRAFRYNRPVSLFMLDLDHFKHVNDAYGHRVGDLMLQTFSKVLLKTLRTTDVIGRVGGEEFAVLLPETELAEAVDTAYRLKSAIAEQSLSIEDQTILHVTTSIGVVEWRPGVDLDDLLEMADSALYQAKQSGRNKVCIAQYPESGELFAAQSA